MTNLDLWIVNVALPAMGQRLRRPDAGRTCRGCSTRTRSRWPRRWWWPGGWPTGSASGPVFLAGVARSSHSRRSPVRPRRRSASWSPPGPSRRSARPPSCRRRWHCCWRRSPPERRPGAARAWAAVGGLAAAAGPVLGGLLVEANWRWVFVINAPIGVGRVRRRTADAAARRRPRGRSDPRSAGRRTRHRADGHRHRRAGAGADVGLGLRPYTRAAGGVRRSAQVGLCVAVCAIEAR